MYNVDYINGIPIYSYSLSEMAKWSDARQEYEDLIDEMNRLCEDGCDDYYSNALMKAKREMTPEELKEVEELEELRLLRDKLQDEFLESTPQKL